MRYLHLLTVCLFCTVLLSVSSKAQRKNAPETLKNNKIRVTQTYSFQIVDGLISQDSSLSVIRKYNHKGNATHTILFHEKGPPYTTYEYLYDAGGDLCIGSNVFSHPGYKLQHSSAFYYNIKGQHTKSVDSSPRKKKISSSKSTYNKQKKITTVEFFKNKKLQAIQRYGYDKAGKMNSSLLDIHTEEQTGSLIDDALINTYVDMKKGHRNFSFKEEYNNKQLVTKFTFSAIEKTRLLGADGMIDLLPGDELKIILIYYDNGLLQNKTQYLNEQLNAFVNFRY